MLFSLFLHSFACDLLAWYWSATRHRIGTVQHSQLSEFSRLAHWSRPCWTAMNGNGRRPRRLWPILGSTRRSDADLCPTWRVQGSDECPTFQQSLLLAMLLVVCYLFTYVHMCPHVSTYMCPHVSTCPCVWWCSIVVWQARPKARLVEKRNTGWKNVKDLVPLHVLLFDIVW